MKIKFYKIYYERRRVHHSTICFSQFAKSIEIDNKNSRNFVTGNISDNEYGVSYVRPIPFFEVREKEGSRLEFNRRGLWEIYGEENNGFIYYL